MKLIGNEAQVESAKQVLLELLELSRRGNEITEQNVNYALSLAMEKKEGALLEIDSDLICHTISGKAIKPKTLGQKRLCGCDPQRHDHLWYRTSRNR